MSAEIITIIISSASLFILMLTSMGGMFAWFRNDMQKQFDRIGGRFEKMDEHFAEIRNDLTDLKIVVARIDERLTIVEGNPKSLVIATH